MSRSRSKPRYDPSVYMTPSAYVSEESNSHQSIPQAANLRLNTDEGSNSADNNLISSPNASVEFADVEADSVHNDSSSSKQSRRKYVHFSPRLQIHTFDRHNYSSNQDDADESLNEPDQVSPGQNVPLTPESSNVEEDNRLHHREVNEADFEFGYNSKGDFKRRLIVFHDNSHMLCYQYRPNQSGNWYCMGCKGTYGWFEENIFHEPTHHQNNCVLKTYTNAVAYQNFIKKKYANKISKSQRANEIPVEQLAEAEPDLNLPEANRRNAKRRLSPADLELRPRKKTTLSENCQVLSNSHVEANEISTVELNGGADESFQRNETKVPYKLPTSSWLRTACQKFCLIYNDQAFHFLQHISIDEISESSKPGRVRNIWGLNESAFRVFSLFLSGHENAANVRKAIINYFLENFKSSGRIGNVDFTNIIDATNFVLSTDMTDTHWEIAAILLECKIGLWEGEIFKKFGDWKKRDSVTLLFKKENGTHAIVLSLI